MGPKSDDATDFEALGRAIDDMHQKGDSLADAAEAHGVDPSDLSEAFGGFMDNRYGSDDE